MNRFEALKHAVKAHAGETDRCGKPAILHPIAVAEVFESSETYLFRVGPETVEDAQVVALLHDVWEDTEYDIPLAELSEDQRHALWLISKNSGDTYAEYITHVCSDPITSIVKLADLHHNLSPERQACLPEKEQRSLERRYLKARDRIWEALGYCWWPEPLEGSDG